MGSHSAETIVSRVKSRKRGVQGNVEAYFGDRHYKNKIQKYLTTSVDATCLR